MREVLALLGFPAVDDLASNLKGIATTASNGNSLSSRPELAAFRNGMRLELVTDGAQQVVPVGHVAIGLSTPRGTCPSTTPTMPRPRGVTATKMSTALAVAQWIVQTSGTALTGLRMLTGNPSRKKITKQCPAAMACALRVASSTNSGPLPVRRTNRGPEASQKASPNRSDELTPTMPHAGPRPS